MIKLLKSASATFNGSGEATIQFNNGGMTIWRIKLMNTQTNSTSISRCIVYNGDVSPNNQIDASDNANADTSPCDITVQPGEKLTIKYTRGTPGSVATYRIEGEESR